MSTRTLPIIEGADGITRLSTWMVVIREGFEFAEEVFRKTVKMSDRAFRLMLTVNHESVHILQGMTTATPYSYSLNLLQLCQTVMRDSREGILDLIGLSNHRGN